MRTRAGPKDHLNLKMKKIRLNFCTIYNQGESAAAGLGGWTPFHVQRR
jgi:hypothetical protein